MAELNGGSAAGAASGELAATAIANAMYPNTKPDDLSQSQKDTVTTLATIAAGMAGGIAGGDTSGAISGAQAGKNSVENNSMSQSWGGLVPTQVQQDATLAFDPSQHGKSAEEISDAIDASHVRPSWGTEYKVKPNGKAEISGGAGFFSERWG